MKTVNPSRGMLAIPNKNCWLFFRFYGPEPAVFAKSWQLPDLEPMK
jgi:hypothetical protein